MVIVRVCFGLTGRGPTRAQIIDRRKEAFADFECDGEGVITGPKGQRTEKGLVPLRLV